MQANLVNGWREVLARILDGFETEFGLTPDWLVNPDTNRRLKLDYFFPELSVAVRFVGLEGTARKQRKSDDEVVAEESREQARAAVCRAHDVVLISIDPDGDPRGAAQHRDRAGACLVATGAQHGHASRAKAEADADVEPGPAPRRRVHNEAHRAGEAQHLRRDVVGSPGESDRGGAPHQTGSAPPLSSKSAWMSTMSDSAPDW